MLRTASRLPGRPSDLPRPSLPTPQAMDSQKQFTAPEIQFLLSCSEADENEMIDFEEFANRFQEPARDIGFNVAVLLTNLSEHVPHDPRLRNFLELAESILEYFRPYLGRIEIMGASRRIERIYFEISETNRAQWEMPQVGGPALVHARLPRLWGMLLACLDPSRGCACFAHLLCRPWWALALLLQCTPFYTLFMGPAVPLHIPGSPTPASCRLGQRMNVHAAALVCLHCGCWYTMPTSCTLTLGALACPSPDVTTPTPWSTWLYTSCSPSQQLVVCPLLTLAYPRLLFCTLTLGSSGNALVRWPIPHQSLHMPPDAL